MLAVAFEAGNGAVGQLWLFIVAPLIGPVLDRLRHGRRWAIGGTLALRAFLCWVLAGAVAGGSSWLFPVAMCVLVASKAYLVSRSAATCSGSWPSATRPRLSWTAPAPHGSAPRPPWFC